MSEWSLVSDTGANLLRYIIVKWHTKVYSKKQKDEAKAQGKNLDFGDYVERIHAVASQEDTSTVHLQVGVLRNYVHCVSCASDHLYKLSGKSTADLTTDGAKGFEHAWLDRSMASCTIGTVT